MKNSNFKTEELMHLLEKAYRCSFTDVDCLIEAMDIFKISVNDLDEYWAFAEDWDLYFINCCVLSAILDRIFEDKDAYEKYRDWLFCSVPWNWYLSYHFLADSEEHYKEIQKYCEETHSKQWSFRFLSHSSWRNEVKTNDNN